jgi:transposase
VVEQSHTTLSAGGYCPCGLDGKLYRLVPGSVVKMTGGSLVHATRYYCERLRCSTCGDVFTANLPDGVSDDKYSAELKASLVVHRYYLGMPFYRLAAYQQSIGLPLPDATQWMLAEQVAGSALAVYGYLLRQLAQSHLLHSDDTKARILVVLKSERAAHRTGTFTTGIMGKYGEHWIYAFLSGVLHSGENMERLLAQRDNGLAPPIHMADASTMNTLNDLKVIVACCLAHGTRKFIELHDNFPEECDVVLDLLSKVYEHDAKTKGLTPEVRLHYHQQHSQPLMDKLHHWLMQQLTANQVEPNSALGQAFNYLLKHWQGLTAFLHYPGAPLDNNCLEAALKIPIRARKNSLFYRTLYSSWIGSVLTSLIHTAVKAGVNPVDYLTALQQHQISVVQAPESFLPWNYQTTLAAGNRQAA